MVKQTLFISYCWSDGATYANELERQLKDEFDIWRDQSKLDVNDDIFGFMAQIANCDIVVIVLTQGYVESQNCMLEMSYLVSQEDWEKKAMVLVPDNSLYTSEKKEETINRWNCKRECVESNSVGGSYHKIELERLTLICENVEEFLNTVAKRKNPSQIAVVNEIVKMSKRDRQLEQVLIKSGEEFVFNILKENGQMTLSELCEKSKLSKAAAHRYVRNLIEKGDVQSIGSQRSRYYSNVENK